MRFSLIIGFLVVIISCSDGVITRDCCKEDVNTDWNRSDELFVPNAVTPNGDGLNDVFRIVVRKNPDGSSKVKRVYDMKARNSRGKVVYQADSFYTEQSGVLGWDMKDENGDIVKGDVEVEFAVEDLQGIVVLCTYSVCSFSCEDHDSKFVQYEYTHCRFEDMIAPTHGFVNPTQEPFCP